VRIAPEQPGTSAAEGERKTVTALFADIKGSTELMRDLDPEEARAIIDPALKLMIDAVHRYDGYVVQSTGDGIFALFGAPVAHEDHPQRALHAAITTRDELRRRGEVLRMQGRAGVEVRIGVNTGAVVMRTVQTGGHTEYSPVGHVINLASRLQGVAPPDGIVVSEETRRLVEGYFELRGLGPTEIKGIGEPINVYEVGGVGALHGHFDLAARRGLTKFVGRERELEQMQRALNLAIGGNGQIVAVVAEAGTGKSRLFYEFKVIIPTTCKVLEAYSVSHGKASAWLPVLELLHDYLGIEGADDPARRRAKVRAKLIALDPELGDTLPYLFALLGVADSPNPVAQMDPRVKHQRTLDAIKRIILRESLNQPLAVIFEDLHWIDAQTQSLLDLVADSIASARVCLLVNYRPEYRNEWTNRTYHAQLRLDALGSESAAQMLSTLLDESVELNPLKRLILQRTEGNPFFIEEMVRALFDEGVLTRNGAVKVTRSLSQLRLPPTVQGILAARIDRQPGEHKALLQTLAVMGRESPLRVIRQMASVAEVQLERILADLQAGEFVYEQSAATDVEYVFKHALTQEVAYNSLLIERRKQLHERAGQALESMFAGQLDDHLGELARQYSHSDNSTKAIEYLGRAGQQALQRSAYADAISSLTAAIDLLQKLPDRPERIQQESGEALKTLPDMPERAQQELSLQITRGPALIATKGYAAPEVEKAYTRARELCQQVGETPLLFRVLFGLWAFYIVRAEHNTAYSLGAQLLNLAERQQNTTLLIEAHWALGACSFALGEATSARTHLERSIALYDPHEHRTLAFLYGYDPGMSCQTIGAWVLWSLGYPDQALRMSQRSITLAEKLSHPFSLAYALGHAARLHQFRREEHAILQRTEAAIALSTEQGFPFFLTQGVIFHGVVLAEQRSGLEGIAQIQRGIAAFRATGAELYQPYFLALLAEAEGKADQVEEALAVLAEALAVVCKTGEGFYEAELYRLKGELTLRSQVQRLKGNVEAEAERCFWQAIKVARKQSGKSLELRATTSLARLLERQGRRDEARTILADIYGWFTEGFDTTDLKDAKVLLEEL
jgi:class 3 adenylate cyclase/predicted ATPase